MATLADTDWLAVCRRACGGVRAQLERFPSPAERAVPTGRGEGGDIALVIDRAAEDAIFAELESLNLPLTVISEERGHVDLNGGGDIHLIVDPIDGSRNAKRGIPAYSVSIAVAGGDTIGDVQFAYVYDLAQDEEWHAAPGQGAFLGDDRLAQLPPDGELEILGLEMIHPGLLVDGAPALQATGAARLRALGSFALSLCWVAAGRFDGMVSLSTCRSVDFAAGQLIVREAGGAIAIPDAGGDVDGTSMDLDMRTRVIAAANESMLDRLLPVGQT
ncbi:MAG: monophosphatase [Thermoleophilaceae bacterium]|jgi:myo-inositol-1(or 4)-monophosphatase|nr:monophosphatase [Thermoleophilaceae bacterium]